MQICVFRSIIYNGLYVRASLFQLLTLRLQTRMPTKEYTRQPTNLLGNSSTCNVSHQFFTDNLLKVLLVKCDVLKSE